MNDMESGFAPVEATSGKPIRLGMQRLWLGGRVLPAGARLVVQHVFQSEEKHPLEAIYSFPLPRDAALRSFRIVGDGFEAHSELKPTAEAVKAYERGITDGSLSALARLYGDGVVSLTVGNIRPKETITVYLELLAGVELRDDGFRFRFPFALAPAYHSRMRVAVADGEGEIELPVEEFGDVILPRFRDPAQSLGPLRRPLHEVGFELSVLHTAPIAEIGSPSHAIKLAQAATSTRIALAPAHDLPNRDLVLDVRFQECRTQVLSGRGEDGRQSFATIVPSTAFGQSVPTPRRVVIVLDRSGSMEGAPILQAKKAIEACLAALTETDSFGLVVFDDQAEIMNSTLLPTNPQNRAKAREFLEHVEAGGGTELANGIMEAARILDGGGDVIILTDGQVSGTETILAKARATGIRLFCLGIGSASQDRFLSLLASETGGVSRFVSPREHVDLAAVDVFASIGRPVASGLKTSPEVQLEPPDCVFGGTPVLLFGAVDPDGGNPIRLTWEGGSLEIKVPPGDAETGETVRLLRGSRQITAWESRYPSQESFAPLEKRKESRILARLRELSNTYQLASREMSLVAVFRRPGDRAGQLPETHVVPIGMSQDTAFRAYFGDAGGPDFCRSSAPLELDSFRPVRSYFTPQASGQSFSLIQNESASSDLLELAATLEPDGGMPGDDLEARVARSVAAVLAFVAAGHMLTKGPFRLHVNRLVTFLKAQMPALTCEKPLIQCAIDAASTGNAPPGGWLDLARESSTRWKQIEEITKLSPIAIRKDRSS